MSEMSKSIVSSSRGTEPPHKRQRTTQRGASLPPGEIAVTDDLSMSAELPTSTSASISAGTLSVSGNIAAARSCYPGSGGSGTADNATRQSSPLLGVSGSPDRGRGDTAGGSGSMKGKGRAGGADFIAHPSIDTLSASHSTNSNGHGRHGGEMDWQVEGGARVTSSLDVGSPSAGEVESTLARDEDFYINGADCVIRVEDTLFRVHRYFLGRDSSAFQHMFSMPTEGLPSRDVEGCLDGNPIRLFGESVERFRALLSVIYDLPLQLQIYNTPAADVDRLLTIAEMTNKYHFASIEKWAVNALYNVISGLHGPPQQQYELGQCSSAWMKRLLEVALLCGHNELRDHVAKRWVERIIQRDLRPVHALEIAERSGVKSLLGYAYYVQLLEMDEDFNPGVVEDGKQYARSRIGAPASNEDARAGTPAVLSREQKQRLLSGHWSLTRLWERLWKVPPKFERPEGCTYHQHGCLQTWGTVWRSVGKAESTLRHASVDVLGRLKAMEEQLFMHADLSCALTPQCKRAALLALKASVREVQDGLAGHFTDLTADARAAEEESRT